MDATKVDGSTTTSEYEEYIFKIACATPLPTSTAKATVKAKVAAAATVEPKSAPSARLSSLNFQDTQYQQRRQSIEVLQPPHPLSLLSRRSNRRNRPPSFDVYVDPDAAQPPTKKTPTLRKDGRTALGVRRDSGNVSVPQSPAESTTPFTSQPGDFSWVDFENYESYSPSTASSTYSTPPPIPPVQPRPRAQNQRSTVRRSRPNTRSCAIRPPNMALYDLLGLKDWKTSKEEINAAYKRVAVMYHPDKVSDDEREEATTKMQRINAARDVLLDAPAKQKYDKDGKLPWDA